MSEIEKFPLNSMDINEEQLQKLKQLFPEVFAEGNKIDWDKLRLTLGETVDVGKERFGMNWPGKADCFKIIQQPSLATLVPAREESVNFDTTENLFIEGDNLEVLKLLQKSYLGKIKMIYIDPPYNTGNDFIYPDNYSETLETYLAYTGQVDSEGRKFSTNTDTEGRFHSKWMNMMYPRLFLAKNLLKDDGVLFISIDDNELRNLKSLCDEIFGEENFVANIIWQKKYSPQNDATYFSNMHDYILCVAKRKKETKADKGWDRILLPRTEETNSRYKNPDNDPRGNWKPGDFTAEGPTPNCIYPITSPTGKVFLPPAGKRWVFNKQNFEELILDNRIWFGEDGKNVPALKRFQSEVQDGLVPNTIWFYQDVGHTQEGKQEVNKLFDEKAVFDYPKPSRLLRRIVQIAANNEDICLDFFAGSCPLAHAVLSLNSEDNNNRSFICVQLPEPTDQESEAYKAGYDSIAEIGKERIRRVIKKIEEELKQNADMFTEDKPQLDLGFKVFKLAPSNFTTWDANVDKTAEAISKQLELHINHISESADQEAILYELLLKSGFELTTKIEKVELENKSVFSIGEGELLICLERELTNELIKAMAERKPIRIICLDEGFQNNDQLKTNAALIMKTKGVVKFQTV